MKMKWKVITDDGNEYRILPNREDRIDIFSGDEPHSEKVATITEKVATTYRMVTAVEHAITDFENFDSLNLEGIERIEVVGERPKTLPAGWVIFNAARPLAGSLVHVDSDRALASGMVPHVWTGVFISGVFYAAVDPADDDAQNFIDQNRNLDARILQWVPVEDHRARVLEWADRAFGDRTNVQGVAFEEVDRMYRNYVDIRIIDVDEGGING